METDCNGIGKECANAKKKVKPGYDMYILRK